MKTAILILLLASCVPLPSIAHGAIANLTPQQSSRNSTTDAGSGDSSYAEHATVSSQRKDQKQTVASDERAHSRHVSAKTRPHSRATLKRTYRPKQVQHNHEHSRQEDVRGMHQQVPTKPTVAASKVVNTRTTPVRPVTGVAISGQQFRNGRNRSATPAVIGGLANTRRNTEAISGSEVNRRHLN